MSRHRVSFNDTIQEFEHQDSMKINKNRLNNRADFKKKRAARQKARKIEEEPNLKTMRSNAANKNGEMVCICVPRSMIISNIHDQNEMQYKESMDDDVYYDQPEDSGLEPFDNDSIYKSLPELEESILEIEDDLINIPVLGKNYRTHSFR